METSSTFFGAQTLHLYRGPNGLLYMRSWCLTVTHGGLMSGHMDSRMATPQYTASFKKIAYEFKTGLSSLQTKTGITPTPQMNTIICH